jgi:hypothetical protein
MDRELLEMGNVNLTPLRQIEICVLAPRKRPLDYWVRDVETIRKRPIGPIPSMSEQSAEDVDVRLLDHARTIVSGINT